MAVPLGSFFTPTNACNCVNVKKEIAEKEQARLV